MPLPDTLQANLLYLIVLGAGTGETVLLRVPPDQWVLIDSFRCAGRPAGEFVVKKYSGRIACIVLTHPHQDHYLGILELIDSNPSAVLGCVHPKDSGPAGPLPVDAMAALKQRAKATYVRISDEWHADSTRRWATFRGEPCVIGDARMTSLHPAHPLDRAIWGDDPNELSSALFVEWHALRLLLGADVPNTQWPAIAAAFQGLGNHAAMKVPHHGSREAIHASFGEGPNTRCWLVTPFAGKGLPKADDLAVNSADGPEGLARVLSYVQEVHLTSLPFRHDCEAEGPCVTTRTEIRNGQRLRKTGLSDGSLTKTTEALNRQVIVAFDKSGRTRELHYGAGTVLVR
jgi:hypothetical protein